MNSYVPMFVPGLGNRLMWMHLLWRGGLQGDGTGWGWGAESILFSSSEMGYGIRHVGLRSLC